MFCEREDGLLANMSISRAIVIPVLAYPDVNRAAAWLSDAFGLSVRLRIGNHRVRLNASEICFSASASFLSRSISACRSLSFSRLRRPHVPKRRRFALRHGPPPLYR